LNIFLARCHSQSTEKAILGYINTVPPESPEERAVRHCEIAEIRELNTIVMVHRKMGTGG